MTSSCALEVGYMNQNKIYYIGMQILRDHRHPTIIKDGTPTSAKGLQPASTKQQTVRKVTTIVKTTGMLYTCMCHI